MRRVVITLLTFALGAIVAVLFLNGRNVEGQAQPAAAAGGFSAVPNAVGTQDVTGPYEVVKGWPKDISTLAFGRDATVASLPGTGGTDQDVRKWLTSWEGRDDELGIKGPPYWKLGVDAQGENCLVVYDGQGNIIET